MGDFKYYFDFFENCTLTCLEKELIYDLFPYIEKSVGNFVKERRENGSWPRYDTRHIHEYKEKINEIVRILDSSDETRKGFIKNFPKWESQRNRTIEELIKIAESMKNVRQASNIGKVVAGSAGVIGGAAIIGSLLFPPAAPALLPGWLGGAALASALPSLFLGTAPVVSSLAVGGTIAAVGGAAGNIAATVTEMVLTDQSLDEAKKVIARDRELLKDFGVSEFLEDLNNAINNLFGKSTSIKILNDLSEFLNNVPTMTDNIHPVLKALLTVLRLILPEIGAFLVIGTCLASVILSIFFVIFLVRRQGCSILNHRFALGLASAVDAGVAISRLVASAGLKGTALGELIPRQLAGKIAVGAMAGVGIALDVATIVISSIDLAEGSMSEESLMIFQVVEELKKHLSSYQEVKEELEKCDARRLKKADVNRWTTVVVNHVPLHAGDKDIITALNDYLHSDARDCILLEKLPTNGNHWLVKVPTDYEKILLRQTYINVKGERCLVMQ